MLKREYTKKTFRGKPVTVREYSKQKTKYAVTDDTMFAAYVQMAKDYPETIEKYL